jgi:hypothetical protein
VIINTRWNVVAKGGLVLLILSISGFRNVEFSSNLEFRGMNEAHKASDSECDTPCPEPLECTNKLSTVA